MKIRERFKSKYLSVAERAYVLEAVRSPEGFSIASPLIFGGFLFAVGFLFSNTEIEGISFHVLDFSILLSGLVTYLTVRLFAKFLQFNQLFVNVGTWILIGLVGVFTPSFVVWSVSGNLSGELLEMIPTGLVAYPVLSVILSVGIAVVRISSKNMEILNRESKALKRHREELLQNIESLRGNIRVAVEDELSKAAAAISDSSLKPAQISKNLLTAIDSVIRPLSHNLAEIQGEELLPPTRVSKIQEPKSRLGRVQFSTLVAPVEFFVGSVIFILPAAYFFEGFLAMCLALLLALTISGVYSFLGKLFSTFETNRFLAIAFVTLPASLIGLVFHSVYGSQDAFGVSAGFMSLASVNGIIMALLSRRIQIMEQLRYVNHEAQSVVALLRQEAWVLRTQFAKAIHGQVQAKFLSVALRIGSKKELSRADFDLARAELQDSLASVANSFSEKQASFKEQMELLSDSWDEVVEISVQASEEVISMVDKFPIARVCLFEVLSEAVSNAAKHSRSPRINVQISITNESYLDVVVVSDGRLSRIDNSRSGYGSRILNEVTSAWFLSSVKGKVYLTASIQLLA